MLFRDEWLSQVDDSHLPLVFPDLRAELAGRIRTGEWQAACVSFADQPIGLAVVVRQPPESEHPAKSARLILGSIYVRPRWRRSGVGRKLLRRILDAAERPVEITYRTDLPARPALTALLDRENFGPPHVVSVCCQYRIADSDLAQVRRWRSRPGLSVVSWLDLTPRQRERLDAGWVPSGLDPRLSEAGCDPSLSLALLHHGNLAGWLILHRLQPDLFRCTTGYVQPASLPSGGFALLCQELIQRQEQNHPDSRTIWTVNAALTAFTTFLRRRLQPAGAEITEFHRRFSSAG